MGNAVMRGNAKTEQGSIKCVMFGRGRHKVEEINNFFPGVEAEDHLTLKDGQANALYSD